MNLFIYETRCQTYILPYVFLMGLRMGKVREEKRERKEKRMEKINNLRKRQVFQSLLSYKDLRRDFTSPDQYITVIVERRVVFDWWISGL